MKFRLDKGTGYLYCYAPQHRCANAAGKVLEHVLVMSDTIGRCLESGECVHHIDRDKTNNKIDNLRLMSASEHSLLHHKEDRGYVVTEIQCPACKMFFNNSEMSDQVYCSSTCSSASKQKFDISKEELELLVWLIPTVYIARVLGVSDTAISKRCKKFNISKPPRGYWRKMETRNKK